MGRTAKKRNGSRNKNKKGGTKTWESIVAGWNRFDKAVDRVIGGPALRFQTEISENIFTSKLNTLNEGQISAFATKLSNPKWILKLILKTCTSCQIYLDLVYNLAYDKLTREQLKDHLSRHTDVRNYSGSGLNDTYKAKLKIFFTEFINKVDDVEINGVNIREKYPITVANDPTITTKEHPILAKPTDSTILAEPISKITPLKVTEEDGYQSPDDEEELNRTFREEISIPEEKKAAELTKLKREEQLRQLAEKHRILREKREETRGSAQSNPMYTGPPPLHPYVDRLRNLPPPIPRDQHHNLVEQQQLPPPLPPNLAKVNPHPLQVKRGQSNPGSRRQGRRGGKFRRSKSSKNKTKRRHK